MEPNNVSSPQISPENKNPKKNKFMWLSILIIILIVIGGGAAYAYSIGLFTSPEKTVKNALFSLSKENTFHTKGIISLDIQSGFQQLKGQVTLEGDIDQTDKENPKASLVMDVNSQIFSANADLKIIDNIIYFKLNNAPALGETAAVLSGIWFSLTQKEIEDFSKLYGSSGASLNILENKATAADLSKYYEAIEKHKLLSNISSEGFSNEDGALVKRYKVILDKTSLVAVLTEVAMEAYASEIGKMNNSTLGAFTAEEMNRSLTLLFKEITLEPVIIDVGVIDGKLHGFTFGLAFGTDQNSQSVIPYTGKVTVKAVYSKIGENIVIAKPEQSKPLMDIVNASLSAAQKKGTDAAIKAHTSSFRPSAEIHYDKIGSYTGLCTSKDTSILSIIDELKKRSGSAPICKATAKAYSFASVLTDGTYYCVDSTGAAVITLTKPTTTSCK